jgi:hypothetical protein
VVWRLAIKTHRGCSLNPLNVHLLKDCTGKEERIHALKSSKCHRLTSGKKGEEQMTVDRTPNTQHLFQIYEEEIEFPLQSMNYG